MTNEVIEFGLKKLKISALILPGDWKEILASEQAREQAESIQRVGLIHPPTVRKSDKVLICGAYRTAGLVLLETEYVHAKVIECNDEHVKAMRSEENSERRHDPEAQREARRKRLAEIVAEVVSEGPPETETGRKRSVTAVALERQADELGVKTTSLYQATYRDRQRAAKDEEKRNLKEHPPVNDRGMELDEAFSSQLLIVRQRVLAAKSKVLAAATSFASMKGHGLPFSHKVETEYVERLHTLAADIALETPITLCPYCRALAGVVENCNNCRCTGWLSQRDLDEGGEIPIPLLDDEEPAVLYQGSFVTVDDYLATHAPEPEEDLDALWA